MGNVYHSDEHPTDLDLLERILAGDAAPPVLHCRRCTERAKTIARAIDPVADASAREPFDEPFYRRQAARIRARIAADGARPPRLAFLRPMRPRLAWAGAAAAVLVLMAVALSGRPPVRRSRLGDGAVTVAGAEKTFASAQDAADDQLLREVDDTLDEDPYDF